MQQWPMEETQVIIDVSQFSRLFVSRIVRHLEDEGPYALKMARRGAHEILVSMLALMEPNEPGLEKKGIPAGLKRRLNYAYGEEIELNSIRWGQLGMAKYHALTPGAKFGMRPAQKKAHNKRPQQQQQEQEGDQQQQPQQQEEQEDDQQQPQQEEPEDAQQQQQPQQQQQEQEQQQQPQQQEEQEDDQQQPMFSLTDLLSVVRTIADAATFSFGSEPQLEERDALTLSAAAPLPEAVPVPEAFDESAYIEV